MRDGSSGRTLVKQGMTLRTETKRPRVRKISAWDTRLGVMNASPALVCVFIPLQNSVFSADRDDVKFDRLAVFTSEAKKTKQSTKTTVQTVQTTEQRGLALESCISVFCC